MTNIRKDIENLMKGIENSNSDYEKFDLYSSMEKLIDHQKKELAGVYTEKGGYNRHLIIVSRNIGLDIKNYLNNYISTKHPEYEGAIVTKYADSGFAIMYDRKRVKLKEVKAYKDLLKRFNTSNVTFDVLNIPNKKNRIMLSIEDYQRFFDIRAKKPFYFIPYIKELCNALDNIRVREK